MSLLNIRKHDTRLSYIFFILLLVHNGILILVYNFIYRRDPKSLVKPIKIQSESDENTYNKELATKKSKAIRHIILIRHGQYNLGGKVDTDRTLTDLGQCSTNRDYATLKC